MNAAVEFMVRTFKGKPPEMAILLAMAKRADGCCVSARESELSADANVSSRDFYRCVRTMERESGEIRRLSPPRAGKALRAFHLEKFCAYSANLAEYESVFSELCPMKDLCYQRLATTLPDLRNRQNTLPSWQSRRLPFPKVEFLSESCEECHGTGHRLIARSDGQPGMHAALCRHEIAAIVGQRWQPASDARDDFIRFALPIEGQQRQAPEQTSFDWDRAKMAEQKARHTEWLRRHPEVPAQAIEAPFTNVIVIRRKTA